MALKGVLVFLAIFSVLLVCGRARPQVPAIYVFGDSTADVGNNNYLPGNEVRANFPPNGIDFPHSRPTGRFSNGYNGVDFIAANMGFRRSPPPYRALSKKFIIHEIYRGYRGASFASAGSGILDSTGTTITMTQQIEDFKSLQSHIIKKVGAKDANTLLAKSIFLVSSGGNDVFAFFQQKPSANETEIGQFVGSMVSNFKSHFEALYNLGARKFAIVNVPPIGCCPYSRTLDPSGNCINGLNDLVQVFNKATQVVLENLSSKFAGMKYSIGSSFAVVENIIADPQALGFKEVKLACCGSGRFNAVDGCTPNATYCEDRHHFLFWDQLHPTHATSKLAGWAFHGGSTLYASPINFKQLIEAA